jgi:hypothetical protein
VPEEPFVQGGRAAKQCRHAQAGKAARGRGQRNEPNLVAPDEPAQVQMEDPQQKLKSRNLSPPVRAGNQEQRLRAYMRICAFSGKDEALKMRGVLCIALAQARRYKPLAPLLAPLEARAPSVVFRFR